MQGNRSRDTQPELALRRELHQRGLRYRVNVPVPGFPRRTIDIAWKQRKIAVFCDGCYWHGCQAHSATPRTNTEYWAPKILGNIERDRETRAHLEALGWTVITCWEHDAVDVIADVIERAVRS